MIIYHNTGPNACYGKALKYLKDEPPAPFSLTRSSDFEELDGSPLRSYTKVICGACGEAMALSRDDFKELPF